MPVPSSISELSTTPGDNPPVGGDAPSVLDNHQRTTYAFIKELSNNKLDADEISAFAMTLLDDANAAAVLTTLGISAFVQTILNDADAGTVQSTIGGTTLGKTLFTAASETAARSAINVGIRGHLSGLGMSTAGSSTTLTVAAGEAIDSTSAVLMKLASAMSKTTSSWAVGSGNGGKLHAAAIANNTPYHWFLIYRSDTGVVDVGFDVSTTPTLPTNYTHYRRIGAWFTNSSAQWYEIVQSGDYFQWGTPILDVSASNPGTSAVTRSLTVPSGISVIADLTFALSNSGTAGTGYAYFSALDAADVAASVTNTDVGATQASTGYCQVNTVSRLIKTDTSGRIRSRLSFSDANVTMRIRTNGWYDTRGKND